MMEHSLPNLQSGFHISTAEPASRANDSTIENTTVPEALANITNPLATVAPHVSQLIIHVRPDRPKFMRYFQTFGLPEELMHGRRHTFGLTRSAHLLRMRSIQALLDIASDPDSIPAATKRITTAEEAFNTIHEERLPFLEGIDKYLTQSVMSETGYLNRHIDQFVALESVPDQDTAEKRFTQVRQFFDDQAQILAPYIYESLADLEATYGRHATEVVADAALDTPYLVGSHDIQGVETIRAADLDLRARFEAAVDALRVLDPTDVEPDSADRLVAELGTKLSDPTGDSGATHPRTLDLPLLDIPQSVDVSEGITNKYDVILEAPTEMGQILNAAFRFTGNFGGAIYRIETDDGIAPNWQVNPLIADVSVDTSALGVVDTAPESYKELWETVFVGNQLLTALLGMVGSDAAQRIDCPLCGVSVAGACQPDGCGCHPIVQPIQDNKYRIVRQLRRK